MTTVEQDAAEYGLHVHQGGWRLGLLVARNVQKGTAGRPKNHRVRDDSVKVSAQAFAKLAGTSADRVLRHLTAWDAAAADGHVAPSADLAPGQDYALDADALPDWSDFYPPVSGGADGRPSRGTPTTKAAKATLDKLPADAKAEIVAEALDDADVADAVMSSPRARQRVTAAAARTKAAARTEAKNERKASKRRGDSQEVVDGRVLSEMGSAMGRVIGAARAAAETWRRLAPSLSEDGHVLAIDDIATTQQRIDAIFDAMRGDDVSAAIDKILAEAGAEGR